MELQSNATDVALVDGLVLTFVPQYIVLNVAKMAIHTTTSVTEVAGTIVIIIFVPFLTLYGPMHFFSLLN